LIMAEKALKSNEFVRILMVIINIALNMLVNKRLFCDQELCYRNYKGFLAVGIILAYKRNVLLIMQRGE